MTLSELEAFQNKVYGLQLNLQSKALRTEARELIEAYTTLRVAINKAHSAIEKHDKTPYDQPDKIIQR